MICGKKPVRIRGPGHGDTDPQEALAGLLSAADENQRPIRETIERILVDKMMDDDVKRNMWTEAGRVVATRSGNRVRRFLESQDLN
jgi:hypothetical protein